MSLYEKEAAAYSMANGRTVVFKSALTDPPNNWRGPVGDRGAVLVVNCDGANFSYVNFVTDDDTHTAMIMLFADYGNGEWYRVVQPATNPAGSTIETLFGKAINGAKRLGIWAFNGVPGTATSIKGFLSMGAAPEPSTRLTALGVPR